MKKNLIFFAISLAATGAFAQATPQILLGVYGQKLSPDGKWIVAESPDAKIIYDRTTEFEDAGFFPDTYFGNGNTFALDGICVGSTMSDEGVVYKSGEMINVQAVKDASFCALNGITSDAKRVCGTISNPDGGRGKVMYVPFYLDMDETGIDGIIHYLPYPDKDFMDDTPQYINAVWISNDGKTILGQVIDGSGMYVYPIVFKENEAGEWTYSFPTESFWNPNKIELPENPGEFEMTPPDAKSYMTPEALAEYETAYNNWITNGYDPDLYPEPTDYMTEEAKAEYQKAKEEYQAAADAYDAKNFAFLDARNQIFDESTPFVQNGFAMNADGSKFAAASQITVPNDDPMAWMPFKTIFETYIFDINEGTYSKVESQYTDIVPTQMFSNGQVLGSTPAQGETPTRSYIFIPGNKDYIAIEKYLEETNPDAAKWIYDNLTAEVMTGYDYETDTYTYETMVLTGHVAASEDFSVIAGGVQTYFFPDEEMASIGYMTYVFEGLNTAVKSVSTDNSIVKVLPNGVLSICGNVSELAIYDLSGRNVLRMAEASGNVATALNNGIYVLSYTDSEGNKVSKKIAF